MGLACTVCEHPQRIAIDAAIASGGLSERSVAKQFDLGSGSVHRHKAEGHLGRRLAGAIERADAKEADEFLDFIRASMAAGAQGSEAGMSVLEKLKLEDPALVYRMTPAFLSAGLRAAELLGQATGRLNQVAAGAQNNLYLAVVLPRQVSGTVQPEQPVIDVTPDPEDK